MFACQASRRQPYLMVMFSMSFHDVLHNSWDLLYVNWATLLHLKTFRPALTAPMWLHMHAWYFRTGFLLSQPLGLWYWVNKAGQPSRIIYVPNVAAYFASALVSLILRKSGSILDFAHFVIGDFYHLKLLTDCFILPLPQSTYLSFFGTASPHYDRFTDVQSHC